ncbi:heat shock factor protein isoform X2 [Culicoides brevitarsis]|uniref:heat shock factor protein isoform X2 n=1 Tax=Culicoides brevitarsis TaxID=469753 RepID=UPI00307B8AA6
MHTFGDTGTGVPAFLAKLWRLVEDPETNDLIYWSTDGRSFIIQNQARFAKELLPLNYKHNNMASFIRQLNMYGFHKITSIDNGGLRFDRDEMEFSHPCFQKGHAMLLEHIKRKIAHPKVAESKEVVKIEAVNKMLGEVKTMRGRQDALDSRFSSMKQENEALWREVAMLRQKHINQQKVVNKIIQFLVNMMHSRGGLGAMGKHRTQLMINDAPRSSKVWINNMIDILNQRSASPIIHELEEELLDGVANADEEIISEFEHVTSPGQDFSNLYSNYYQPQATTSSSALYDNYTQPQYNNCYVLDDEVSGDMHNGGRKSADYVVDHADDYELGEIPNGQNGRKRTYSGAEEVYAGGAPKVVRQQAGATSVYDAQQTQQRVKTEKADSQAYSSGSKGKTVPQQQSLLKGTSQGKKLIKQEKDQFAKYEMSVPDIVIPAQQTSTSPSSSTGSGKSFYSKDDLFTDEMPNELFGDDANTLLTTDETPLLGAGNVDLNSAITYNPNTMVVIPGRAETPGTSNGQQVVLSDGSNMQVTKFNGKSNNNDISKLMSHSEFDSHLNDVQSDLDALKDILRGENYQFDTNALLNFAAEQPNYNRYFMPSQLDAATMQKLFNADDVIGAYEMPAVTDTTSVANVLPGAPSPGTNAALTEYAPDVDLSDLLEIAPNGEFEENNQQTLTSTQT